MRLETHCHTKYSKDSMLSFTLLYIKCKWRKIDAIAITEHNNIQGGLAFKEYCQKKKTHLQVIVGEEVMTESGEIIGLFLQEEIPAGLSCKETIARIRQQNGVVYVPHPYDKKREKTVLKEACIKEYASQIDCIECYNGRNISDEYGIRQNEIADRYHICKVIGSDAHTILEVGRNYMEVEQVPVDREMFLEVIQSATFHKKKCIKLSHKITKFVKLGKLIKKGNFHEVYRIIKKRLGSSM